MCFGEAVERCDKVKLLAVSVDKDHVHFIVSAKPSMCVSNYFSCEAVNDTFAVAGI